ncbi:MAG TPA: hypothetical protein VL547_19675 [Dinghuibacter sp.]|jgi:hypothetical protein|uniref:hypothetical protein n=1 Tax=Dinghuibacter sp. TaxID=2024697 RepID=UPI002C5C78A8|nr:hypothetical protein [Dinghuibacter sp.]HTJ14273.1 hypothetical protein [Dinghuibacter sp.]
MVTADGQKDLLHPDSACKVCGAPLYSTDHDNFEITYHCSSAAARFWDYDRGTRDQDVAKTHWDNSREEICLRK